MRQESFDESIRRAIEIARERKRSRGLWRRANTFIEARVAIIIMSFSTDVRRFVVWLVDVLRERFPEAFELYFIVNVRQPHGNHRIDFYLRPSVRHHADLNGANIDVAYHRAEQINIDVDAWAFTKEREAKRKPRASDIKAGAEKIAEASLSARDAMRAFAEAVGALDLSVFTVSPTTIPLGLGKNADVTIVDESEGTRAEPTNGAFGIQCDRCMAWATNPEATWLIGERHACGGTFHGVLR